MPLGWLLLRSSMLLDRQGREKEGRVRRDVPATSYSLCPFVAALS